MSEENFKTDVAVEKITQLPNDVYESGLKGIIKDHFEEDEYEIEYSAGSKKGDNYIGVVYRIEVTSKSNPANKLHLIAKLPPQDPARREQFFARVCFLRESQFYDEIYPLYENFQKEKEIKIGTEGFHQVPFCFKSMTDEPFEGLFFEDLKAKKFEMFDRFKELTEEHVFLTMKSLAKMHAIYFCLKDQKPELIEKYREMKDIFLSRSDDNNMIAWFNSLKGPAREAIKDCKEELVKKVDDLFKKNFFELMFDCVNGEHAEPYAILCHGDCWNNNMLYQYDENEKPVDIRLLDFQILRYASPVCDLVYYIFCCTTKELRDSSYHEFMNVYYKTLTCFIERLGSKPENIFPRYAFEEHLKRFGKFGLVMATMILPIITTYADEVPDLDEMARKMQDRVDRKMEIDPKEFMDYTKTRSVNLCNERMRDVIIDMFNLGYI